MSNNIYNILGKLNGITDTAAIATETTTETVYESVEARGSITEAVKSLEGKYAEFKEGIEDKIEAAREKAAAKGKIKDTEKETPKSASRFVKGKSYGGSAQKDAEEKDDLDEAAKPDFLDVDGDGNKKEPFKKAVKNKKAVEEAVRIQGAANYDGKMAAPKNQRERDEFAARAKHERAKNRNDMSTSPNRQGLKSVQNPDKPWGTDHDLKATNVEEGQGPYELYNPKHPKFKANYDKWMAKNPGKKLADFIEAMKAREAKMNEVAPPGAKAERMVKHIKKGYAKDGNLTNKEKAIAYATTWAAHKKGQVEEGVEFKDTIANSKAELKKAKPAKVTEGRVMEETDYFYEKVGKALANANPHLDTAGNEFYDAVRKEMVAQGIPPNRARNILMMDEDFLSDVATSYAHYCTIDAHQPLPAEIDLNGTKELDEIAALAGLPAPTPAQQNGLERSTEELDEREQFQSMPKTTAPTPVAPAAKPGASYDKSKLNPMREEEVEEGNEFSGALAAAKASGAKEFEVDGKRYTVKEDINVNITANGQEDALNLFRKLAGMDEVAPAVTGVAVPVDAESAIAQGIVEPIEVEVDEERDIEYTNTPNEKIGPVGAAIPSGNDMNRAKKSYSDKPYRGDNPMAVQESTADRLWKKYSGMLKSLIIK